MVPQTEKDGMADSLINRQTDKKTDRQAGRPAERRSVWSGGRSRVGEGSLHVAGCNAK